MFINKYIGVECHTVVALNKILLSISRIHKKCVSDNNVPFALLGTYLVAINPRGFAASKPGIFQSKFRFDLFF